MDNPPSEWACIGEKAYRNLRPNSMVPEVHICPRIGQYYRVSVSLGRDRSEDWYQEAEHTLGGLRHLGLPKTVWIENIVHPNDIHQILDRIDKIEPIYPVEIKNHICLKFGADPYYNLPRVQEEIDSAKSMDVVIELFDRYYYRYKQIFALVMVRINGLEKENRLMWISKVVSTLSREGSDESLKLRNGLLSQYLEWDVNSQRHDPLQLLMELIANMDDSVMTVQI